MNTTTITLLDAPEVVFISRSAPSADRINPIANVRWHKPSGGIWTCPASTDDNWYNWCAYEMPEWLEDTGEYRLVPAPGTKVARIDSFEDLKALIAAYPTEGLMGPGLDFEAMARDFDGIWLTSEGQWATRFTTPGLYGWDLETVLFFRWVFVEA